ncbi:hypothetical protein C7444_10716 [Sphaerotilus hippei]|uniref:Tat pathway signal protein n=1 Tax=Sphaerotilus hippei TaxID=744406 RepID=A0A318H0A9_9BURK|nr:PhoX family phosphatase [Sphaerotilus hippei]PXW96110.1 hypothetical protein C7444_10716 [Sphaerotilus hippei]
MPKDHTLMEDSNRSGNPSWADLAAQIDPTRRRWLQGGLACLAAGLIAPLALAAGSRETGAAGRHPWSAVGRRLGFTPLSMAGPMPALLVPPGYTARVIYRWGDPVGVPGRMPAFKADASNSAAEQALQAGMHHDGMAYFPLAGSARHGLLAMNHEYTDEGLLHPDGRSTWTAAKVAKSMAAHGVSIVEVAAATGRQAPAWAVVRPSRLARRITASTPMQVAGPAAGHRLLRTAADPAGTRVLGTFGNCASGATPWGTYLTCEENFQFYFEPPEQPDADQQRWGLKKGGNWMRWHEHEERFDLRRHPNEFHRFGWVVEIDPADPDAMPVKRTALGRAVHEGAASALTRDGRVAIFMGEDARFEYIYKFVSRDAVRPGGLAANRELLDHGTLYVARFDADGTGRWLPLVHGQGPLTVANGFADQGEVVIKTRQASDLLGATKMDRPEWTSIDPLNGEVYVTLTNNSARGQAGLPGADAAHPRAPNLMGHILRWRHGADLAAERFDWDLFVLAGDAQSPQPLARGNVQGDAFGSPDGLLIDPRGVMWICTDGGGPGHEQLPRNQLLACDPTLEGGPRIRRFLIGPNGCEVTGPVMAPDCRTLFVNLQHPGETDDEHSLPGVTFGGAWPEPGVRPRSATVAITKDDGGIIGL